MRRLLALVAVVFAALLAADAASATRECAGFRVCVHVAGPWVLAPGRAETQWQLSCPKHFVVGGLDAELSTPALYLGFRAALGSPVNPGISTSTAALFLARRVVGRGSAASFRPHIGCIPAAGGGGGSRVPTVLRRVFPPARPAVVRASLLAVRTDATLRVVRACRAGERLVTSSDAIGFFENHAPSRMQARAVHVTRKIAHGRVTVTIRGGSGVRDVRAVVQLDLLCAGGR